MESEERPRARPSSRQRESFQDKEKVVKKLLKDDRLNTITPSSGLDLLIRQVLAPRNSGTILYHFDEEGNPIRPPASPLRRSMQPLDNIVDRMRLKQKSWYDGNEMEAETDEPSRLLNLPTELQFYIISYLGLSDLERLRRTCQYYRFLLSANYVRALFGGHAGLVSQLTGHCLSCISTPGRNSLILQHTTPQDRNSENRARKPAISSKCFSCAVHDRELEVGKTVPLANMGKAWVCRWCGWPVAGPHSWANEQFHVGCYDRYYRVLWVFLSLGFAQFGAGIGAAVLSVVYFRDELVVFAPTVVSYIPCGWVLSPHLGNCYMLFADIVTWIDQFCLALAVYSAPHAERQQDTHVSLGWDGGIDYYGTLDTTDLCSG